MTLNITRSEEGKKTHYTQKKSERIEAEAKYERKWLLDPEQFNPSRDVRQSERINRSWGLLLDHIHPINLRAVDLGCGWGTFSKKLRDAGALVDAVDIAQNALKIVRQENCEGIVLIQDYVPATSLEDRSYPLVVALDLIAELPPHQYRLFFSETARLITADGVFICSSPIDIYTDGGVERLIDLAQTEFTVNRLIFTYGAFQIKLEKLIHGPSHFREMTVNPRRRTDEITRRSGLKKYCFTLFTSRLFYWFWHGLDFILKPVKKLLRTSTRVCLWLEKCCAFVCGERGISHVIFSAKRKSLIIPDDPTPIERPKKTRGLGVAETSPAL